MTNTSAFEVELLREKHHVLGQLEKMNNVLLDESLHYLGKDKVLAYHQIIQDIINSISEEYNSVREKGKQPRSA